MEVYFKTVACIAITVILSLTLVKKSPDISLVLSIAVCTMAMYVMTHFLTPVIDFISQLQTVGQLDNEVFQVLLKAVGLGLLGEICSLICADSGNTALGKAIQILTVAAILWLSLPLMNGLLQMLQGILGDL